MYKELIADLQGMADKQAPLVKSQPGDAADANIQAAGATGGDSGDGGEGAAGASGDGDPNKDADAGAADGADGAGAGGDGDGDGDGAQVAKSFAFTLDDGTKFEAIDGTELLKALQGEFTEHRDVTGKALGLCVTMIKSLVADNADMRAQLTKLAGAGTGRRALLSVAQRPSQAATGHGSTLTKSDPPGMKPQEFLLKAETAMNEGKLSPRELALAESYINRGEAMPAHIIQRVMGGQAAA